MNKLDEKVKIHAHLCGDGSLTINTTKRCKSDIIKYRRKNKLMMTNYVLEYCNTNKALLDSFYKSIIFVYNKSYIYRDPLRIQVRSKEIFYEMKKLGCGKSREWFIPPFIRNSKRLSKVWIGAFCDDEAHIDIKRRRVHISSINFNGLKNIFRMLKNHFKIKSKVYGPYFYKGFKIYRLTVFDTFNFCKLIKFEHTKKKTAVVETFRTFQ